MTSLAAPLLRPLSRWLGRARAQAVLTWLALAAAGVLAGAALLSLLEPALARAAGDPAQVTKLVRGAGAGLLAAWLVAAALLGRPWVRAARLMRLRGKLRNRRSIGERREHARYTQLTQSLEKRSEQLKTALQVNKGYHEKLGEQQAILRSREALLNMTQDALLLTRLDGKVMGVSPATSTLLRRPRESLVGQDFSAAAPLYEARSDRVTDYPLSGFLDKLLQSDSAIPQLQPATLVNFQNEQIPVLVTAAAILDTAGKALGAMVRINRSDPPPAEAQAKPQLSLAEAGMHDWGTNLLSREPLERRIDELLNDAKVRHAEHMLLFVRVDDLAKINDEHGFWAGEQALWHAARNFAMALVDAGTGYRYSNSRFGALLIDRSLADAEQVAERIRAHAQANELIWEGKPIACTFSIAIVPIDERCAGRGALLGDAETLLNEAKNRGGNTVLHEIPTETVQQRRRDDRHWLSWLEPRLEDGRAHLISQTSESLARPALPPMAEIFIRVEDDDGVWLEPGYYLPALDRLRQSTVLDLWVLRRLLGLLKQHSHVLKTHAEISFNLSSGSLLDPQFAPTMFEILGESGIPAAKLCVEIDESFALNQSAAVQKFIDQLRPTGLRFALDRCHTTMGITHLRDLPVDYMKIHPRVTRNIENDALDRTHLEWICQAAHLLGRKTAAINVESAAAVPLLRRAGVDYAQGSAINKMGPLMS